MANPYLPQQADAITQQANNNLFNYQLPQINSGAIAAGGYGGSRQGIAQGQAIGQTNMGLSSALANLHANAYESDQNRGLQRESMNNSYNLGLGSLGLNSKVADQNFFSNQRGQDLSAYSLGSSLANTGNLGLSNQGQQLYQNGQTEQQAPWSVLQQYGQLLSPFTGLNNSQSQTTPGASTAGSALGGALTAAQLWALLSQQGG
jgi:hypothetical protein